MCFPADVPMSWDKRVKRMGKAVQEEGITWKVSEHAQTHSILLLTHGPFPFMRRAQWYFSTVGNTIAIWVWSFLVMWSVLCTIGCSAVSLVSTHWMLVASPISDNQKWLQILSNIPLGAKLPLVELGQSLWKDEYLSEERELATANILFPEYILDMSTSREPQGQHLALLPILDLAMWWSARWDIM